MASLATQQISIGGITPAYVACAAGGDEFTADDHEFIHVKNGAGAPQTVTIVTPNTAAGGLAVADDAIVIPAGQERMIGPFSRSDFQGSDGLAAITYSAVVSLTIAVLRAA